jgi:hypothetical protein
MMMDVIAKFSQTTHMREGQSQVLKMSWCEIELEGATNLLWTLRKLITHGKHADALKLF